MGELFIGQLAEAADVPTATIRYYERRGLLTVPPRTSGGYRLYGTGVVSRIAFIRRAKELGFSLSEVADLLALRESSEDVCRRTRARATAKIERIDAQIRNLTEMRDELMELTRSCVQEAPDVGCPIIGSLEVDAP